MAIAFFFLFWLQIHLINTICVKTDHETLLCVNEYLFRNYDFEVLTLKLKGGFIAHSHLITAFPNVRLVKVLNGENQASQCNALDKAFYNVQGCPSGEQTNISSI